MFGFDAVWNESILIFSSLIDNNRPTFLRNINFTLSVHIWANLENVFITGQADVIWLVCKQTRYHSPESSIGEAGDIRYVYGGKSSGLKGKKSFVLLLLCTSEYEIDNLILHKVR